METLEVGVGSLRGEEVRRDGGGGGGREGGEEELVDVGGFESVAGFGLKEGEEGGVERGRTPVEDVVAMAEVESPLDERLGKEDGKGD